MVLLKPVEKNVMQVVHLFAPPSGSTDHIPGCYTGCIPVFKLSTSAEKIKSLLRGLNLVLGDNDNETI
jgi:hypothetical protein